VSRLPRGPITLRRLLRGLRVVTRVDRPARLQLELWTSKRLVTKRLGYGSGLRTTVLRPPRRRVPNRRRFAVIVRVTARDRAGHTRVRRRRVTVVSPLRR
jgi:hypothetical protein